MSFAGFPACDRSRPEPLGAVTELGSISDPCRRQTRPSRCPPASISPGVEGGTAPLPSMGRGGLSVQRVPGGAALGAVMARTPLLGKDAGMYVCRGGDGAVRGIPPVPSIPFSPLPSGRDGASPASSMLRGRRGRAARPGEGAAGSRRGGAQLGGARGSQPAARAGATSGGGARSHPAGSGERGAGNRAGGNRAGDSRAGGSREGEEQTEPRRPGMGRR